MIESFLRKYVFDYPNRYRIWLLLMCIPLPLWWVCVALKELWEDEPIHKVYGYWWASFKKGGRL